MTAKEIIGYVLLIGGAALGAAITRKKKIGPVWGAAIGTGAGAVAAIALDASQLGAIMVTRVGQIPHVPAPRAALGVVTLQRLGMIPHRPAPRNPQYLRWGNRW